MSELKAPLDRSLDQSVPEDAVQRMWSGIEQQRTQRTWLRAPGRLAYAAVFAVALVAALLWFRRPHEGALAASALTLTNGRAPTTLGAQIATVAELSDGSRIDLRPGSSLDVVENSGQAFVAVLRRGEGEFEVRPGGPRRWTVEAGLASVEVVGTHFEVSREPGRVTVRVERGVVLVRGERVRDRVQSLRAGDSLVVEEPKLGSADAPATTAAQPAAEAAPETSTDVATPAPSASIKAPPAVDELLLEADRLRKSGDLQGALALLRRTLAERRGDPKSSYAAFTLGKLLLDHAAQPGEAALAFAQCLSLAPPSALAEEALSRLVESEARAGHAEQARVRADEYRKRFPSGRRSREVERWVASPP